MTQLGSLWTRMGDNTVTIEIRKVRLTLIDMSLYDVVTTFVRI